MPKDNNTKMILPFIPLRNVTVFPQMVTHFDVGREKSVMALEKAEMGETQILLASQKDSKIEDPTWDDYYHVGTVATVRQMLKLPGGHIRVLVEGDYRAKLLKLEKTDDYLAVSLEKLEDTPVVDTEETRALHRMILEDLEDYGALNDRLIPGIVDTIKGIDEAGDMVDLASSYLPLKIEDHQRLLETLDINERMLLFHGIVKREIEFLKLGNKINQRVQKQMNRTQKEYFLKEQLRAIHKELGDSDEENIGLEYEKKLKEMKMPEEVREKAMKEAERLMRTSTQSPEHGVLRTYLDWIIELPWEVEGEEEIDIKYAKKVLEEDHYGLKDVKERILEFIAVRKLKDTTKGPVICLVGPPGVGKTSIARSIARALNREFVRMSLGGVRDEAEIRGHRRTYVGALPGKIISSIKKAGTMDPVFLMDEIDKIGSDYRGDPASGLLEVLDPEQNDTFTDHYLDLPYDLSHVLFVTTANTVQTIPRPLLDRMEVIEIGSYTEEEKYEIAKRHLIPKEMAEHGIKKSQMTISEAALKQLISFYTRESGVRGLEKRIAQLCRKAAVELVSGETEVFRVTALNLEKLLGPKKYTYDLIGKEDLIGVVNGLAWTPVGGQTLSVEVNITPGTGKLQLTGKLGDVMKESAMAALSYIKSNAAYLEIDKDFAKLDIHVHVPEGAIPKDGPSAGVTMCTAMVSALKQVRVRRDVAMTGEMTLRGRVLAIGGLKEKLLAAQRMGIKLALIPKENENDLVEVPDKVKEELEIVAVEHVSDVLALALVPEGKDED